MQSEKRKCRKCGLDFILDKDDFSFYEKMSVPAPHMCPDCRFKMRAVWRNERVLYNRKCDLCGRSIISMYNPKSPYVIYCNDCFVSDKWDPYSYAMDYDFSRPFFEQLGELIVTVPKSATYYTSATGPNINSEYTNFAGGNKDAYLVFNSGPENENCGYSRGILKAKDVYDVYFGDDLQNVYDSVNIHKSNGVVFGQNISECVDCYLSMSLIGCQNCFGCVNLRHKSYYFFNKPLGREEWLAKVSEIRNSFAKTEEAKREFLEFTLKFPHRENNNLKDVNCMGNLIFDSKDCFNCFEIGFCENMRYSFSVKRAKDCVDMLGHCRSSELLYNGVGVGPDSSRVISSWWVETSHNIEYSLATRRSEYCIGCDGIKNGSYMVLNKRYSREEYEKIRKHILKELEDKNIFGDFFPSEISPFAYNETIAQDNMPLSKEEILREGFRWEEDIQRTEGKETVKPGDIPDHIKDIPDSFVNEIFRCIECSRNYKIIPRELAFYKKMNLPLPRKCWNCRYADRIRRRGPYKFWKRNCGKCQKEITVNYDPDRPEIVYCEKCYQQEVY